MQNLHINGYFHYYSLDGAAYTMLKKQDQNKDRNKHMKCYLCFSYNSLNLKCTIVWYIYKLFAYILRRCVSSVCEIGTNWTLIAFTVLVKFSRSAQWQLITPMVDILVSLLNSRLRGTRPNARLSLAAIPDLPTFKICWLSHSLASEFS